MGKFDRSTYVDILCTTVVISKVGFVVSFKLPQKFDIQFFILYVIGFHFLKLTI